MHPKPGSTMGAMSGCFSSADDKSDKESNKVKKVKKQAAPYHDAELGCGIDDQIHLLSEKRLELPTLDWLNLPSHLLGAELAPDFGVPTDNDAAAADNEDANAHIPANLFFWSDYHTDFDGTPDYKEIAHPKYDAILIKCATAPADWQVPDLQLPMASTYDFSEDFPSSGQEYRTGKTATSLPCIPTAFEPVSQYSREGGGSGQPQDRSEVDTSSIPSQSATDVTGGGGFENYSYQRAVLQRVNVSYQTATSVEWQRATRAELQGSDPPTQEAETMERAEPTPWELPEEEVKELRERCLQYLEQFDYKPTASQSVLVRNTACRKENVGNNEKTSQAGNTNPDIEYFKQQLAPILSRESSSPGALDVPGPPWPSDADDDEDEDAEYYPELLEDPPPRR